MCQQCRDKVTERANHHWVGDELVMTSAVVHPVHLLQLLPYYFQHMGPYIMITFHDTGMFELIRMDVEVNENAVAGGAKWK